METLAPITLKQKSASELWQMRKRVAKELETLADNAEGRDFTADEKALEERGVKNLKAIGEAIDDGFRDLAFSKYNGLGAERLTERDMRAVDWFRSAISEKNPAAFTLEPEEKRDFSISQPGLEYRSWEQRDTLKSTATQALPVSVWPNFVLHLVEMTPVLRAGATLSDDIVRAEGFYSMVTRQGETPDTKTEVRREGASEEVADALGVEVGSEVVVRARRMGTEEHPLVSLATSYFPLWVVEAAPNLADPTISGLPKWLREAFGDTYSDDLIDARMPSDTERLLLEIPAGVPVIILKGRTYDHDHRVLHFIDKVTVAGRLQYSYRFGIVPES